MLVVVSPAKKLDFESLSPTEEYSTCEFLETSNKLIKDLKKLNIDDIAKLMKLSKPLAELNFSRYKDFKTPFSLKNAKQAAYAFKGDTYVGLDFENFNKSEIKYAQSHLRILSGLYGLLKPLDLIQPYRLEMGTRFGIGESKNLYGVWQDKVTSTLNKELKSNKILVNCASKEYFSAIDFDNLDAKVIVPVFKEKKNGEYKIISFAAKRARGMMSQYIIKNKIKNIEDLKKFNMADYKFSSKLSSGNELVFVR
jgi:cytoplasmic iron level regulating protein YaaA (DUF328/UPF0246 family)